MHNHPYCVPVERRCEEDDRTGMKSGQRLMVKPVISILFLIPDSPAEKSCIINHPISSLCSPLFTACCKHGRLIMGMAPDVLGVSRAMTMSREDCFHKVCFT